jgi:hypothetical protein
MGEAAELEIEAAAKLTGQGGLTPPVDEAGRADKAELQRRDIGFDREIEEQAVPLAVLREVDKAFLCW